MRVPLQSLVFGLVAFVSLAAGAYEDELIALDVPPGFLGPVADSPGPGASMVGYTKPYPQGGGGTLLQITTYDFGASLSGLQEDRLGDVADFYCDQFLEGVE